MAGKKHKTTKRIPFYIAAVIAVVVVAFGAGALVRWLQSGNNAPNAPKTLEQKTAEVQDLRVSDPTAFEKQANETLSNPNTSDSEKYMLYLQQGFAAEDKNDMQTAIDLYNKARAIKDNYETNSLIAEAYKRQGDKSKAIEYLKKSITLISETDVTRDQTKAVLEQTIRDLGGQP